MKLEINSNFVKAKDSFNIGNGVALITPPLDENYWIYRVSVSKNQAIVAFPKFGGIGIGFQYEDKDGNTNLPSNCDTEKIYNHIRRNRRTARRETCIKAIKMIQEYILTRK